ncbi:hypothetical protein HGA34_01765 [Candidatus Falkowbacteria bacterium]|nr:hypothetical protein [Candidatus Falkowbacteria bacterium]
MADKKTHGASSDTADIKENCKIAALSYIFILWLIPLLLKPHSKFAQFHAKQGLVIFVLDVLVALVSWVPFFGQLLFLAMIALSALAFIRALSGQSWQIPYVYEWSRKVTIH